MSPVSRGRKPSKKAARRTKPLDNERREVFELALGDFDEVSTSDDAIDVELLTADFIGSWWVPGQPDAANQEFCFPLIAHAANRRTPGALGVLRALQALGMTAEQRERAGAAADRLAESGLAEPPWIDGIRQVSVLECWQEADVYGDGASLLMICDRAGRRHGLVAEVDFNGGGLEEAFLTAEPDEVLREMREAADDSELVVTEELGLARAHRILEDAIALNDSVLTLFSRPEPRDPLTAARTFLLSRLRAMPPADPPAEHADYGDAERDELVAQFFADTGVTADHDARQAVRAIVDYGCDEDFGRPLRVGPEKVAVLVEDLDAAQDLDDEVFEVLPELLTQWAKWAGERSGLTAEAIEVVLDEVAEITAELFDRTDEDWEDDFGGEPDETGEPDGKEGGIPLALKKR